MSRTFHAARDTRRTARAERALMARMDDRGTAERMARAARLERTHAAEMRQSARRYAPDPETAELWIAQSGMTAGDTR